MDWQEVYDAYPLNREMIWLNNCGVVPAGNHIVAAVTEFIRGFARKGILTETASYATLKTAIKGTLARLINCHPSEVSLVHNTNEGMLIFSHGLNLQPEDEIVLLENEYPSNVYPWWHWEQKEVNIVTAPMAPTPKAFFEGLSGRLTDRTRVVSVSAVHWCTGMPLPIARIGRLCRQRGIDLVVDGAQGVGIQPIDVKADGISFMAFSAWKWLMGPPGLGAIYVARDRLADLNPVFIGTGSVVDDASYLPYKSELKTDSDRFIFSTPSICDWVYFKAALDFLDSIGFDRARSRIFELVKSLNHGLKQIGCDVYGDRFPDLSTGITVFEKPGFTAAQIHKHLKQNGIYGVERLGRVRLSPHVFNTPEQIDRVVGVLKRL